MPVGAGRQPGVGGQVDDGGAVQRSAASVEQGVDVGAHRRRVQRVGVLAGIDQAGNRWPSYGQGLEGYAKRYGATYTNVFSATFIGGAIMPTILKQDPRYFYKGTGSKKSRLLYAVASSVICKGDNGHWQPNYSNVIGSFAGGAIATLYIPPNDRGASFVASAALIRLGETSLAGVLQEFLFRHLTPNNNRRAAMQP